MSTDEIGDEFVVAMRASDIIRLMRPDSEESIVRAKKQAKDVAIDLVRMATTDENVVRLAGRLSSGEVPADAHALVCRHLAERIIADGGIPTVSAEDLAEAYYEVLVPGRQDRERLIVGVICLSNALIGLGLRSKNRPLSRFMDLVKPVG